MTTATSRNQRRRICKKSRFELNRREHGLDRFGRIDTLINNSGIYIGKPFTQYTVEDYVAIIAVNLTGFFDITQMAIEQMVKQRSGHVVNISTSLVDHADSQRPSALPALTKGGLVAASRSLAIEYASRGVRVNAVSLGIIKTPCHQPASYKALEALHPARRARLGDPQRRWHGAGDTADITQDRQASEAVERTVDESVASTSSSTTRGIMLSDRRWKASSASGSVWSPSTCWDRSTSRTPR